MGYIEALEAAGATVIDSMFVGDYQGSWGAIVIYNGIKCLAVGGYGSCSVCDAFQSEFDGVSPYKNDEKFYLNWEEVSEEEYNIALSDYNKRLSDFAQSYLTTPFYVADVRRKLIELNEGIANDRYWNSEEKELYEWAAKYLIAELRNDNIDSIIDD